MIRRPPRSTLFPTRRSSDLHVPDGPSFADGMSRHDTSECDRDRSSLVDQLRSEEHTSELQSQSNLVCRLLLEKKKKKIKKNLIDVIIISRSIIIHKSYSTDI